MKRNFLQCFKNLFIKKPLYLFHCDYSSEGDILVTFVTKEFWTQNSCIEDQYLSAELEKQGILHLHLGEGSRGIFARAWGAPPLNVTKLTQDLLDMGFISDPDFDEWSKNHDPFC